MSNRWTIDIKVSHSRTKIECKHFKELPFIRSIIFNHNVMLHCLYSGRLFFYFSCLDRVAEVFAAIERFTWLLLLENSKQIPSEQLLQSCCVTLLLRNAAVDPQIRTKQANFSHDSESDPSKMFSH